MSIIWPDWPAPANVLALTTTRETLELPAQLQGVRLPEIKQVHGTRVVDSSGLDGRPEADAIIATTAGIGCRVVTADCLPVLFCDLSGRRVAAAHAGWRGLAGGVLEATLDALAVDPGNLLAWIGPAISQDCYEVGGELLEAFLHGIPRELEAPTRAAFRASGDKYLLDLPGLARTRLAYRGVRAIYGGNLCTYSDPARFHSWRRDGAAAGRLESIICLLPEGVQSRT